MSGERIREQGDHIRIHVMRFEPLIQGVVLFQWSEWYVLPAPGYGRYKIHALVIWVAHSCKTLQSLEMRQLPFWHVFRGVRFCSFFVDADLSDPLP